jgi:hypothetical protein
MKMRNLIRHILSAGADYESREIQGQATFIDSPLLFCENGIVRGLIMQIVMDVPHEKADFMIEMLKNFPFVENVTINGNEKTASQQKRAIGLLDGIGDVIIKDDWKMTEEEFLGL